MSRVSDSIGSLETEVNAAKDRVTTDIETLKAKIAELEGQAVSDADIAKLDELKATLAALDPTDPTTLPTP